MVIVLTMSDIPKTKRREKCYAAYYFLKLPQTEKHTDEEFYANAKYFLSFQSHSNFIYVASNGQSEARK